MRVRRASVRRKKVEVDIATRTGVGHRDQ